jgi:hypothetical protein
MVLRRRAAMIPMEKTSNLFVPPRNQLVSGHVLFERVWRIHSYSCLRRNYWLHTLDLLLARIKAA